MCVYVYACMCIFLKSQAGKVHGNSNMYVAIIYSYLRMHGEIFTQSLFMYNLM